MLALQIVVRVDVLRARRLLFLALAFLPRDLAKILREARGGATEN